MKGDFSRIRFDKEKHYSEVLMQQGRVSVDSDWNEQQAINQHRIEIEARDVIGKCGAPIKNAGFKIIAEGTTREALKLNISKGRYYVDGILCENDFDDITYDKQPDLPDANIKDALGKATMWLIYLDVWKRHITALDDPLIREVALSGPDTTTRVKTIWQVKILPIYDIPKDTVNCNSHFREWDKLINSSTGILNARTKPPEDTDNPCLLPPSAGYQRLENQLYRIEIHQGGSPETFDTVTFKWSRDNGSVVTAIEKINNLEITVHDVGPDNALGFASGQWIEIFDDATELNGNPGQMVQIDKVDPATRIITLKSSLSTVGTTHKPKLRRWDSQGEIKVPADNSWVQIESGIEVQFSTGDYKTGDYWTIPARTVTGEIEWPPYEIPNRNPIPQPPAGILHHYCRLALVQLFEVGRTSHIDVQDCRKVFPPLAGEPGIHVIQVFAGDKPLLNDTEISVDRLEAGLRIEFDANVDPFTIQGKPTCFVTVDLPYPEEDTQSLFFHRVTINAEIDAVGRYVIWKLKSNTERLRKKAVIQRFRYLARLTLKGNFIWAQDNPDRYLDGEVFGFRRPDKDNIDIYLPSGNGRRGGDFEMWFWLVPQTSRGSISGRKINQLEEAGLEGWTITLKNEEGTFFNETITNSDGFYSFKDLGPGTYIVEEILQEGWVQDKSESPGFYSITITSEGENIENINFSNIKWVPPGSISGRKMNRFDQAGIKGWTIILKDRDGNLLDRATTNSDGFYSFKNLHPGTYIVEEILQEGWVQDKPESPGFYSITIESEEDVTDIDFVNHLG